MEEQAVIIVEKETSVLTAEGSKVGLTETLFAKIPVTDDFQMLN